VPGPPPGKCRAVLAADRRGMISVRLKGGTASFRPLQLLCPKGQISVFQVARSLAAALPGLALVLSAGGIALVIGHAAGLFRIAPCRASLPHSSRHASDPHRKVHVLGRRTHGWSRVRTS